MEFKMSKIAKRLLVFFIGLPLVLAIVFLNYLYHLPLQVLISVFSILGANEFYNMLSKKDKLFDKAIILIGAALFPLFTYTFILSGISLEATVWIFVFEIIILMGIECLTSKTFENSVNKISKSMLIIFYCGFLVTFISRMTVLDNSVYYIALFFIFVFMCDSAAWFFGVLFGKSTRGVIAASPNKSLVGFIGGIFGSVACGVIFKLICSDIITASIYRVIFVGLLTSVSAIIGDLIESVFKRCCDCKDSGKLMPGRGGILDSIDSIVVAGPVYYIAVHFLFNL